MSSIWDFSTTPANNNAAVPNGAPEGWLPSNVNDTLRQFMADVIGANLCTIATGTDTYACTLNPAPTSLVDGMVINVLFQNGNTSSTPTLNANTFGNFTIRKYGNQALISGDIGAAFYGQLAYVASDQHWELLNPKPVPGSGGAIITIQATTPITGGGTAATVPIGLGAASVTNPFLAAMNAQTFKGNPGASSATPSDMTVAQAKTLLGLGTAAFLNTGTIANSVVQLDGSARLPAVDGSRLTNLPTSSSGTRTDGTINTLTGLVPGVKSVNHGLNVIPKLEVYLQCLTAQGGFAVGDRIYDPFMIDAGNPYYSAISNATATVIAIQTTLNWAVCRKDTGATFIITPANWSFNIQPYKIN